MNLLIAFVILLVLLVSEMGNNHPVEDVWLRLSAIMVTTFLVPMLAAFQTVAVTRKMKRQDCDLDKIPATLKRLTACHSAVWLAASLAIVYSFQWQKIVRGNWELDRWWLIDEVLIIAPVILSLIASWAIFFDIQTVFAPAAKLKSIRERFKYVSLRVRVYLAIFLVPMLAAIGAKDFFDSQLADSGTMLAIGVIFGIPMLLAAFPFLVMLVWKTQPVKDSDISETITNVVNEQNLKVSSVRVWTTSRQIINAVVAGVFPYFRVILVSDGLISQFSQAQIAAILRHEAGHICRLHLQTRMFFIILPIAIYMIAELLGYRTNAILEELAMMASLPVSFVMPIMTLVYCLYLLFALIWLSQRMEYDADQYAVTKRQNPEATPVVCKHALEEMESALLRFAVLLPSQVDRKSLWHPTIRNRLIRLNQLKRNPLHLKRHAEDFVYHQFLLLAGMVVFSTLFYVISEFLISH